MALEKITLVAILLVLRIETIKRNSNIFTRNSPTGLYLINALIVVIGIVRCLITNDGDTKQVILHFFSKDSTNSKTMRSKSFPRITRQSKRN